MVEEQNELSAEYTEALQHFESNGNEFLSVEEKNDFEKLLMYKDKYPALRFRKRIMFVLTTISWVCSRIIKHTIFDNFILLVILFNTTTLMITDP
jgi:hypothetical protein